MENQKQNQKQEQKQQPEQKKFIKRNELTIEQIMQLPRYTVSFVESSKSKTATFVIDVLEGKFRLNSDYANKVTLDFNTWSMIKILANQSSSFARKFPVRFPKGIGKNGKIYYLWELFISEGLTFSGFFTKNDLMLVDTLVSKGFMDPINWIDAGVIEESEESEGLL